MKETVELLFFLLLFSLSSFGFFTVHDFVEILLFEEKEKELIRFKSISKCHNGLASLWYSLKEGLLSKTSIIQSKFMTVD